MMRRSRSMVSRLLRQPTLQAPLRVAAGATWLFLAILSFAPESVPPWIRASDEVSLALAFTSAALVTRLAFRFTESRWQWAAFAAGATLVRLGLRCTLDGRASAASWVFDIMGALGGVVIGRMIDHLSWRPAPGA